MSGNRTAARASNAVGIAAVPIYPDLAGKVAVITGSSRGIGAECARLLAANDVKVVVNARGQADLDALVAELRDGGHTALGVTGDSGDFAAVEKLRQAAEQAFGPVDILLPFAGGGRARPGPVANLSVEEWHSTVDANLTATFLAFKSFLPGMIERQRGTIITMASLAARIPTPAPAPYAAAKAGIIALTHQVADEVGKYGIRVNCISPSTIVTEDIRQYLTEERKREWTALHPMGRLGTPEDVALSVLFLASSSSAWLTGLTLDIAGGRYMT